MPRIYISKMPTIVSRGHGGDVYKKTRKIGKVDRKGTNPIRAIYARIYISKMPTIVSRGHGGDVCKKTRKKG